MIWWFGDGKRKRENVRDIKDSENVNVFVFKMWVFVKAEAAFILKIVKKKNFFFFMKAQRSASKVNSCIIFFYIYNCM